MADPEAAVRTNMIVAADLSLAELDTLRESGDSVLDHCLRRIAGTTDPAERITAFTSGPTPIGAAGDVPHG